MGGVVDTMERLRLELLEELPPVASRERCSQAVGGMLSPARLKRLDSDGTGPGEKILMKSRRVGYRREVFVDWFVKRCRAETVVV